jgi:hypothetical protein
MDNLPDPPLPPRLLVLGQQSNSVRPLARGFHLVARGFYLVGARRELRGSRGYETEPFRH